MTATSLKRPYVERNRRAWDHLARIGTTASDPWDMAATPAELRTWVDELGLLPWGDLHNVLVLCGAGGQQAPTLARLGLAVTVVDLSDEQLALDRKVAQRFDAELETIRADVNDLSALRGRQFDLVYQPASTCYLADPRTCYRNVARLLEPGALYLSEHWNPAQIQLGAVDRWDGSAYRLIHRSGDGRPLRITDPTLPEGPECVYFAHRMGDLVGGICDAGFTIERFGERGEIDPQASPDSPGHVGSFLPSFFTVLARRRDRSPLPASRQTATSQASNGDVPSERVGGRRTTPLVRVPRRLDPAVASYRRTAYAIVRGVLDSERLVPRLNREAIAQREFEYRTDSSYYGIGHDGTYVAGGMSFTSSVPGPALETLHRSNDLLELVRKVTGNEALRRSRNLAYMFYEPGSYIDVHTDLPGCTLTVLTSVVGSTPPLIAYPRLFDLPPRKLLAVARRTSGRPPGGLSLDVPMGGLLLIDGRRLPHRRPLIAAGHAPCGIAALCFVQRP